MKKITLSSILAFLTVFAFAQNQKAKEFESFCSTSHKYNELIENNPELLKLMKQQDQFAEQWTKEHYGKANYRYNEAGKKIPIYIIPVVWHVIHNNGPENISRAAIEAEIANMNEDYQKLNASIANVNPIFAGIAADTQLEFRLARLDPDGNCTEGITRTVDPITYAMDESAKFVPGAESWNRNGKLYFNIWMGASIASGAGGYAYYPGTVPSNREGVVLRSNQLGNTVSHEIGHFFNLAHLWGNSNTPGDISNCSTDDGVSDTPNTVGATGCSNTATSCGSIDNGQNYLEYNFCEMMFTEGQKQRIFAALNSSVGQRSTLVSATNLSNTGVADPYVQNPICTLLDPDFTYNKTKICEGEQVTFNDANTYNGTPTQWDWTFTGGTPNVSNLESPVITYNTAGTYGVTYVPGNGAGWASTIATKPNIITVSSLTAQYILPYTESFESTTSFNNDWAIETQSGNGWLNTTNAAYTGVRSGRVNNLSNSVNDVTELISSSYDLSSMTIPKLNWKAAYAKKTTGGNDQLIIKSSVDCGATWQTIAIKSASVMSSAPATDAAFTPSGTSQWKDNTLTLSAGLAASTNVKFNFYFKSNGGNNIYIDDINVFGDFPVGIDEVETVNNFSIFPNPTTESAVVSFNLATEVQVLKIILKDVLGKEVTRIVNGQSFNAGKYNMSIDQGKKLASGLYFVEFNADNKIKVEKLVVK